MLIKQISVSKLIFYVSLFSSFFLFTSCVRHENIYYWGAYQDNLYDYYQKDQSENQQQIDSLESIIEKAKAAGKPVPPGLHAHLGMLYADIGDKAKAQQALNMEKHLFPESGGFIAFIEKKLNQQAVIPRHQPSPAKGKRE